MNRGRSALVRVAMVLGVLATLVVAPEAVSLQPVPDGPVVHDPAFLDGVPAGACTPETEYEVQQYGETPLYGDDCRRIQFAFGPIYVKPGQNDALLNPVTIEKPSYDGYIVRFKPDLALAVNGQKTQTDKLHLHHATWLAQTESYGDGPFFAAGEEKTIASFPQGYGMEIGGNDQWQLLYMVHNALPESAVVYITYDIDFIPKDVAESEHGITNVRPLWLDVQKSAIAAGAPSTSSNPVFNVQRGYGSPDPVTGRRVCRWPDENCAQFDAYGNVTPQQGQEIELAGADYRVPAGMAGTIIGLGGHLHPGGIRDEVSLVRGGVEKPIFTSDAIYWDYDDPSKAGAPPHSWNLSMTVTGAPLGWKVKIKQGDIIRLNAVYDSQDASWYENMGIVVGYVVPVDPHAPAGVDVFDDDVEIIDGVPDLALTPEGPWLTGPTGSFTPPVCSPDLVGADGQKTLCLRGQVTHGAVPESSNSGSCSADGTCPELPVTDGPEVSEIRSVAFTYGEADQGVVRTTGLPLLKKGQPAKFWNYDTAAKIWHTYTRCAWPCTGATTVNYPIADGGAGFAGDAMDFESMEIGYGLFWEPAKSQVGGSDDYDDQWVKDGVYWEWTPTETGTFSFYCRIHPGMRGAFKVVE